jgi:ribosomal protein S18 acetylase RimI-like enzyme
VPRMLLLSALHISKPACALSQLRAFSLRTLRLSPAMAAGIETRLWEMKDLVEYIDSREPARRSAGHTRRRRESAGSVGVSVKEVLREAVVTDAPAIRELTRAAYAKWVPVIGREPKPMTADYAEAVRKHRFDLLYLNGKLAALIETIPKEDHLLVENVAVSPPFQGRGLGRKLMEHAEKVAASLGFSEIRLYTNKLFAENVHLYVKFGYRVDNEEEFKGGVAVHMSKPLSNRCRNSN